MARLFPGLLTNQKIAEAGARSEVDCAVVLKRDGSEDRLHRLAS